MKAKLLSLFFVAACSVSFAQNEVILNINHMFGDNPYEYNTPVMVEAGYELKVTRLEYYLSDFTITHDGGQTLNLNETHLLVDANENVPFSLGNHDVNTIEGISFSVGVLEEFNHLDPSEYEMGNPLAPQLPSMHWGWASGYRFLAFEGKSGANLTTTFEIHSLGDQNLMNQSHDLNVEAVSGVASIYLNADYIELVYNINVSQGLIQHGTTDEAVDALLNMRSRVFSAGSPVNIKKIELSSFEVYPNPANDQFFLELPEQLRGADLFIYSFNGQVVQNAKNIQQAQAIDVSTLPSGMYVIRLQYRDFDLSRVISVQ